MPTRASLELRETRKQALAPLFDYMTAHGTHRSWLARQLGISVSRVWNYEHGYNTPPEWFLTQACKALGVTPAKLGLMKRSRARDTSHRRTREEERHYERDSHRSSRQQPQRPQPASTSTAKRRSSRRTASSNGDDTSKRADPRVASAGG